MRTTGFGTSTSSMTTQSHATPAVTRPESTWPSSTSTQQHMTTVPIQETTHFKTSTTSDLDNNIIDHAKEDFP